MIKLFVSDMRWFNLSGPPSVGQASSEQWWLSGV